MRMSDCASTGGTHVFVSTSTVVDADGRVTECFRCACGATQTITGPAGGRNWDAARRRIGQFDDGPAGKSG